MSEWKVTGTQTGQFGVGGKIGVGFNIIDARGLPLLTLTYSNEDDADRARRLMAEAVGAAVDVFRHR